MSNRDKFKVSNKDIKIRKINVSNQVFVDVVLVPLLLTLKGPILGGKPMYRKNQIWDVNWATYLGAYIRDLYTGLYTGGVLTGFHGMLCLNLVKKSKPHFKYIFLYMTFSKKYGISKRALGMRMKIKC